MPTDKTKPTVREGEKKPVAEDSSNDAGPVRSKMASKTREDKLAAALRANLRRRKQP